MKVSVLIATHQRPEMLRRALQSVACQTYPDVEALVVSDNGLGTPAQRQTAAVVAEFAGVRYFANPRNLGQAASLNSAAERAQGELFAFLDDDDQFHSDKIALQVKRLAEEPGAGGVYCNCLRFFRGAVYAQSECERGKDEGDLTLDLLLGRNEMQAGSTTVIRRSAFHRSGGFDERFRRHVDWSFMLNFFREHTICLCEETLVSIYMPDNLWKIAPDLIFETKELFLEVMRGDCTARQIRQRYLFPSLDGGVLYRSACARAWLGGKVPAACTQAGAVDIPRWARLTASALKHMRDGVRG